MDKVSQALHSLGYTSFRPFQEEIVRDILAGRDVLGLFATGAGKSLCYQLPAILLDGVTIVISPLISLMNEQVQTLRQKGIAAASLNSTQSYQDRNEVISAIHAGRIRLLFVSPEQVSSKSFSRVTGEIRLSLFAIDEAHCISTWGHQFRPEYRNLSIIRQRFPDIPVVALTATAVPEVRADIVHQLRLKDPRVYVGSFNRPNLYYEVRRAAQAYPRIVADLLSRPNMPGIIYCQTRRDTDTLAKKLRSDGVPVATYHAGMTDSARARVQAAFNRGSTRVICATVAFGMGIDRPDLRFVIHHGMPRCPESYYQESGRAGRDGKPADCILYYRKSDRPRLTALIEKDTMSPGVRKKALEKLHRMVEYCEGDRCRREQLLQYFAEDLMEKTGHCCDICNPPGPDSRDISITPGSTGVHKPRSRRKSISTDEIATAQLVVQCILDLDVPQTPTHIASVLAGGKNRNISSGGHERLKSYGTVRGWTQKDLAAFIRYLVREGLLRDADGPARCVTLTSRSGEVFRNGAILMYRRPV